MNKAHASSAYAQSGVDIDAKMHAIRSAKRAIQSTLTAGALGRFGSFGGLFASPGKDFVLVSSVDGVGTKLKVALRVGRHDTVGQDIVNHCVNDILVQGAEPLFFLDYIGASKLDARLFAQVMKGLCKACRQNGCALIGGETAEMPGLYPPGEYDLVGAIVGAVRKKDLITGDAVRAGDVAIGLPSSGLHTNGYTLARQLVFGMAQLKPDDLFPGTRKSVGDVLLAVHRSYLKPVRALLARRLVTGMAHITGGGFFDNIARILPEGVGVTIRSGAWKPAPLFRFLQQEGRIDTEEMYRVFNMGVGLVVFVRERKAGEALDALRKAGERPCVIGDVRRSSTPVELTD